MASRIGILVIFILSLPCILLAQCDDDDDELPSGSMSASGGGCSPAVFSLSFSLSSNDDDDDDDDDDVFNVSYRVGGRSFTLSGVADGHSVEHTLTATSTAVLVSVTYNGCTVSINSSITLEVSTGPSISVTATAPTCSASNGSLTVGGSGGSSPYEYSLNGGTFQSSGSFSNLAAGTYSVTVRDANGCTSSAQSQNLSAPNAPSLSIVTPLQPSCNEANGAFTAQASGGRAPYEYALNTGSFQNTGRFGNLAAGTYGVTVRDANGCTATTTANLQGAASPSASVSNLRQPTCAGNDGQIQVQAQGGLAPYTYSLGSGGFQNNATFTGLGPGNYTITVRDSRSCQSSLAVVLNSASGNLAPATITGSAAVSACLFENLRLQGNLPAGTSGRWSLSNNLGTLANAQSAQTTFRPQRAGSVEAIWTLSTVGCANYSQAKIQITIPAAPSGKDFSGIEVNKDAVSLKLYAGSTLVELNVLQQGKKGSGSIGVDHVLIYTPKAGQSGADTLYYSICAAECPNACDTSWVAFVLNDEAAICELEKIDPRAIFPEGITPNDDGFNDRLVFNIVDKLGCPSNYAKSDITIFNRWGDKVFVQEPYENQWLGTSKDGGALPPGVYYYVLRIRPEGRKEFVKFGSVAIFK
ncbi:MAG: gliding motility-associated C-terminal domain-containing protein [Haliscomenobacter sp.]|uniref:T9SS type B sorting domain-containing protein n=1 Tax=Haliscomenobacter sp. TaxID=2717303 RepID=UPI0029B1947C|nr:gliding motility-associated C-terminal domain-containing protein [Haliscomenobacter sp.]MDX2071877.1 gliding motility-associated C-terminal domain-containing protein [Haliscomenobacter sp.]